MLTVKYMEVVDCIIRRSIYPVCHLATKWVGEKAEELVY